MTTTTEAIAPDKLGPFVLLVLRSRFRSPLVALNGEKMVFVRRWPRSTARRWHLFVVGRAQRREDGICSSLAALNGEKMAFVRRWPRSTARRWHLFAVGNAQLREHDIWTSCKICR